MSTLPFQTEPPDTRVAGIYTPDVCFKDALANPAAELEDFGTQSQLFSVVFERRENDVKETLWK